MPLIRQLPPGLVNKIAAGEVIERPASVVKELMENAIDAGATRVELQVDKGGLELIRVSDDGCGIEMEQLPLAVAPHATSKLIDTDDLFHVRTLGFRGEALASIAEISHLTIRSRTASSDMGGQLDVRGGELAAVQPIGAPVGTSVEVRHLFFNTPVRRKFLKAPQTEMGHVVEAFTRIALGFPQVHLLLKSNDRQLYDVPAANTLPERIRIFFGDEVADALISVESNEGEIRIHGYVTNPSVSRSNNRMQYLFLNGRYIRDRSLQHALGEAYRGLLMVGKFPICFLRIDMPPSEVDVNVHPTKTEVRFVDGGKLYSQTLHALRHKFLTSDLTAVGKAPNALPDRYYSNEAQPLPSPRSPELPLAPASSTAWSTSTLLGRIPDFRPFDTSRGAPQEPPTRLEQLTQTRGSGIGPSEFPWDSVPSAALATTDAAPILRHDRPHGERDSARQRSSAAMQVHNRYLITEDENGMVVVDQHALHERILYEQLRERVLQGSLETQKLLVPEPVSLTPLEAQAALDAKDLLLKVGIGIEPFGGDTVLISSYPAMISNITPSEMLRKVLEPLLSSGKEPEPRDLLDSILHTIACKAAIKAGDKLSPEEISALLEQRHCFTDTHHCPHGRPTALFFSRDQLDKMFKRT